MPPQHGGGLLIARASGGCSQSLLKPSSRVVCYLVNRLSTMYVIPLTWGYSNLYWLTPIMSYTTCSHRLKITCTTSVQGLMTVLFLWSRTPFFAKHSSHVWFIWTHIKLTFLLYYVFIFLFTRFPFYLVLIFVVIRLRFCHSGILKNLLTYLLTYLLDRSGNSLRCLTM